MQTAPQIRDQIERLPKVDLHRHLEGSMRLDTMLAIARRCDMDLPRERDALQAIVQIQPGTPLTSSSFLYRFETLRRFFQSPEIIHRVTREAISDAAADHVCYLELHFTPRALAQAANFQLRDIFDWVVTASREAAEEYGVELGLIASVNRHEDLPLAEQVVRLAAERIQDGIVGVSLAGDEVNSRAEPFLPIFREAGEAGLGITIHAGEWAGPENVRYAIEIMGAKRIGHGVRVLDDPDVAAIAHERRTVFEVCLTSNMYTGVIANIREHPLLKMIQSGLHVTLNSDDPGVFNIRLTDELALAVEALDLSMETLKGLVLTGAQASFGSREMKAALEEKLVDTFFHADSVQQ
jgi:adenosine deaminase